MLATQMLAAALRPLAPHRLLEVACGDARCWEAHAREQPGLELVVFDATLPAAAPPPVASGMERLHLPRLVPADPCALPWPGEWADAAACCMALHRLSDPESAVRELERVVQRGGHVVVVDRVASEDAVRALLDQEAWAAIDPLHVRSLGLAELCRLLGLHELRVESVALADEVPAAGATRAQRLACVIASKR